MMRPMQARIARLEDQAGTRVGRGHQFIVPDGLSDAGREAWMGERERGLPPGDFAIFRIIVDPPARPADGADE